MATLLTALVALAGCTGSARAGTHPTGAPAPSPAPSGSPSASPSAVPSATNPFLARVPKFGPAPQAQPVTLPVGPRAPFYTRIPTTQPVAFLTMDDGWVQSPDAIKLMQAANIPFTMFLIAPVGAHGAPFFRQLVAAGGTIAAHTISHPSLRGRSYDFQHHQICDSGTQLAQTFGTKPQFFRPPYGNYDGTTLRVAHDCGYTAVLNWTETVDKGIVRYQTADHRVHPGDIILMHFRPAFVDDVLAALKAIQAAGLVPAVLSDYLVAPST